MFLILLMASASSTHGRVEPEKMATKIIILRNPEVFTKYVIDNSFAVIYTMMKACLATITSTYAF